MNPEPRERKSGVDKLKDALYSRKAKPDADPAKRSPLPHNREHTPHNWDVHPAPEAPPPPPPEPEGVPFDRTIPVSVMRKMPAPMLSQMPGYSALPKPKARRSHVALYFLLLALIFFLGAAAVAAYLFLEGSNTISSNNIDVAIAAPSIVDSGKPAVIEYVISNRNQEALESAELQITYPTGTRSAANLTQDLPQERVPLGTLEAGGQIIKTTSAAFFGTEGAAQKLSVKLQYRLKGSNATFTKNSDTSFIVGSAPVSITVSAPDEAISGQTFNFDATVTSNATMLIRNLAFQAQFPFGWQALSADPPPDTGNLWRLGDLGPGESKVIHFTGTLVGSDGDARVFHFLAGSESDTTGTTLAVPLLTSPLTILVRKPVITASIAVNNKTGSAVTAPLGDTVNGSIAWQNNLPVDAMHAIFTLSLKGSAFDPDSVSTNGFYDSSKSQIVWNDQTDPALVDIAPGRQGVLQFSFKTLSPAAKRFSNPQVDLALTVAAVRTGQGNVPEDVTAAAHLTVNLASTVTLNADAEHFVGPFGNSGPMPPQHNQATTYTVLWTLKNSSNDLGSGGVTATLPPYVTFVSAGNDTSIEYDEASRVVTWTLGNVTAGAGYTAPIRSAAFQVSMTPSVNQVGQIPNLTTDATFTGQDRFAGVTITTNAIPPSTRLTVDPKFVQGMEMVK